MCNETIQLTEYSTDLKIGLRYFPGYPLEKAGKNFLFHFGTHEIRQTQMSTTGLTSLPRSSTFKMEITAMNVTEDIQILFLNLGVNMLLAYSLVLLSNLSHIQRTYAGLWRPNKHCDSVEIREYLTTIQGPLSWTTISGSCKSKPTSEYTLYGHQGYLSPKVGGEERGLTSHCTFCKKINSHNSRYIF